MQEQGHNRLSPGVASPTIPTAGSPLLKPLAFGRLSSQRRQNLPIRPLYMRGALTATALSCAAIAIGLIALAGYFLGNASIASLGGGKPVSVVTAVAFILLGSGLLALRSPNPAGVSMARSAALGILFLMAAVLLWAMVPASIEAWQLWDSRGGIGFPPYPVTAVLLLALGFALFFVTTRHDFAGHLIASAVLMTCVIFLFAYFLRIQAVLDPVRRVTPVLATVIGLALISCAVLLMRPRGWIVPLLSQTSTGIMTRVLLLATFIVPYLASASRDHLAHLHWFPATGLATAVDVVEVFFSAAVVIGIGVILHKRDSDQVRLAAIVDSSTDAIIGKSRTGVIDSWNAAAERMYGYTAAEAIGRPIAILSPPQDSEEVPLLLEQIRRGERVEPFETVRVAKDGRRIDVRLSLSPILDDGGNVAGVSTIAHDITERKSAEQAMLASEARYRTLVENLPQKILLKDRNSVYVSVNDAYARDLGIESNAVAGKSDHDFFPEELAGKYRADDVRIMEAGVTEDLEEEYIEGTQRRFVHTVKTPVRDPRGNVTHILVIFWDVTEKKLADERLEQAMAELERFNRDLTSSESALKEAQRNARIGHWQWSALTSVTTWSDEVYRILEIPIGSVTPSYELFLSLIVPEDQRRFREKMEHTFDRPDKGDFDIDLRVTTPAGTALVISERVICERDAAGNLEGFHGTMQDITKRVEIEEAFRDSEAALGEAQQIANIGSAIVYPETGEIHASPEYFRIFDLEPRAGTPIDAFINRIHDEDRAMVKASLKAAASSGVFDAEFRITCRDGSTRFAHGIARTRVGNARMRGLLGTIQDVTDQRRTEETLRRQNESLEQSNLELDRFNRLAAGRELRMIELKQQMNDLCRQWGQPPPHVFPEELAEVRSLAPDPLSAESIRHLPAETREIDGLRIRLKDGDDGNGAPVSQSKSNEANSPEEAEHLYRLFFDAMNEGTVIVAPDGIVRFCNRRFAEMVSASAEGIVGEHIDAISNAEVRTCLAEFLATRGSCCDPRELRLTVDGDVRTLRFEANRLSQDTRMAILVTDVTVSQERTVALASKIEEMRRARLAALNMMEDAVGAASALERANRDLELQIAEKKRSDEAHRRLATIVEQASETIVITDLDGTIIYVNPAFERITGYTSDEAIGQTSRMLSSGKQNVEFYQELWATIRAGLVWHGHFINRRKDGVLYQEEATISPVRDASGTIINYVAIKRDVTAEVALTDQLRHAQKIEAVGTLAGGVAHDFNNLLQAMLSIVQLLKRKSALAPRDIAHMTQLEKTIRRGSYLTRQLLLFARRQTSRRQNIDLNGIVDDLLPFLRRVVRANIRLDLRPANVPLLISADHGQIDQVIMNLVGNAVDAMPEGGVLSVAAGLEERTAWFQVSDTGVGISEAIRERIFEPFFTTKEVGKGTGLGLSVVHGIVAAHGGKIDVHNRAEGGTVFRVELPLQNVAAALTAPAPTEEDVPNGRGERVLLVEDDQPAREGLAGILEMIGYSVVAVGAGEDAVAIDEPTQFSVVLTDSMLPGMPGIDVVRKLRERWPDIKSILMSGYASQTMIDAGVASREFSFLQKPFDIADLARMLRTVLESSEAAKCP
jgi:PAS domain S-box-containing protein